MAKSKKRVREEDVLDLIERLSADDYTEALAHLLNAKRIPPSYKKMLVGHANAENQTASMKTIAGFAGWKTHRLGNLHYGKLAKLVSKYFGVTGEEIQAAGPDMTYAIAWVNEERDALGECQWTLREEFVEALRRTGILDSDEANASDPITTSSAQVETRRGQEYFRKAVLEWWGHSCAVTGCKMTDMLVAGHVLSWENSDNRQRLDHFNGLPLIPNLDKAFDRGLISFADSGDMLVSSKLDASDRKTLGIEAGMRLRKTDPRLAVYLVQHRRLHGF